MATSRKISRNVSSAWNNECSICVVWNVENVVYDHPGSGICQGEGRVAVLAARGRIIYEAMRYRKGYLQVVSKVGVVIDLFDWN